MYLYKTCDSYYLTNENYIAIVCVHDDGHIHSDKRIGNIRSNYALIDSALNNGAKSDELIDLMDDYENKRSPVDGAKEVILW